LKNFEGFGGVSNKALMENKSFSENLKKKLLKNFRIKKEIISLYFFLLGSSLVSQDNFLRARIVVRIMSIHVLYLRIIIYGLILQYFHINQICIFIVINLI